jgi:uncharacterized protein (DUF302 family)
VEAPMSYYFAVAKLKDHGFGVLTKIDVQATLKEKIS